ncbi:hypothetical protein SpiGrapes_0461 [Sphaerochaeta pleomorpha str. Grapes]|uniref:Uncharacterized protein n=1 Tax=Sphaerochaeta pleomorpha (strain ATCC BAA-1885 / DSM 22778 / Grapes) TaxID=158190 RepID=G8QW73_SPHPG|nr:hypothetical protein [Sphaerochaeta pleomorpha]AEV28316.1 hypothetical protein SpiGrapes_0461 [Sphaerochaeta pleomorpha str. Grapes]
MKRLIWVLLVLCLAFPEVFAVELRASNSIGQDKGPYDPSLAYALHLEGTSRSLFKGDVLVWKTTQKQSGREIIKTTSYADSPFELVQTYRDTLLLEESDGVSQTIFAYGDDGKLQTATYLENGELVSLQSFFYDSVTHQLSGSRTILRGNASYRFYGQEKESQWVADSSGESFEKITIYPNTITVKETWKGENRLSPLSVAAQNDGAIALSQGDVVVTYNNEGLLVQEKKPSFQSDYQYNEQRELTKETKIDAEGRLYVTDYLNGKKVSQQVSKDEILEKVITFNADKTRVETLYDKGVAYCDVTYAADGMRVLSLKYR